jgi:hypothetical protein
MAGSGSLLNSFSFVNFPLQCVVERAKELELSPVAEEGGSCSDGEIDIERFVRGNTI